MIDNDSLVYNTARPKMLIPEYGRNVQKMVDHAVSIPEREQRNKVAEAIIKVMGELKPELRDVEEYKPKLWTHLFIMSDFNLDVDSPYPMPKREALSAKPEALDYPQKKIKIGHYGKNVEILIGKAIEMEDPDEREALVKTIACMMKQFYLTFNTQSIEDKTIADHIKKLSDGKIILEDLSFLPSTGSILKTVTPVNSGSNNKKQNSNNKNRNNNNNNKNRSNNNNNKNRKRF